MDCSAAVEFWTQAYTNFEGLPEAYAKDKVPYNSAQNVSFIALFNPKENPEVDCAYFTCPAAPSSNVGAGVRATSDREVRGLLCVTTPNALTQGEAPFE